MWVEGEEAARSFWVAPNSTAVLWDNNRDTIYFKRTDTSGRPLPMMILDFVVRDPNNKPDYITREEFQKVISVLMAPSAPAPMQNPAPVQVPQTENMEGVNNG